MTTSLKKEIASIQLQREQAETQIQRARSEIPGLHRAISQKESELAIANTQYESAYRQYVTLEQEHERLRHRLNQAHSDLDSWNSRFAHFESGRRQAESRVHALQEESRTRRHDLSRTQDEIRRYQGEITATENALRSFKPDEDLKRRINTDKDLASLEAEAPTLPGKIESQKKAVAAAEAKRNKKNEDLQACAKAAKARCEIQRHALTQAQTEFHEARDKLKSLEERLQTVEVRRQNRIRELEQESRQQRDLLASRVARAKTGLSNAQLEQTRLAERIRSLSEVEIPRAGRDLARAESELASFHSEIRKAQSQVTHARSAIENFERSSGYSLKKSQFEQAYARIGSLQKELSALDQDIRDRELSIAEKTERLRRLQTQMEQVVDSIREKEARSSEIQKALAPYYEERNRINDKKSAAVQNFDQIKADYERTRLF